MRYYWYTQTLLHTSAFTHRPSFRAKRVARDPSNAQFSLSFWRSTLIPFVFDDWPPFRTKVCNRPVKFSRRFWGSTIISCETFVATAPALKEKRWERREDRKEKRREETRREEKREIERRCKMWKCNENVRIISIFFLEEPYAQALSGKTIDFGLIGWGNQKIAR